MEHVHIRRVLDYVEEHLKDDRQGVLDNAALARVAGYSEYHFLRVFRDFVHLTPADYIRKRRISEIVRRIGVAPCRTLLVNMALIPKKILLAPLKRSMAFCQPSFGRRNAAYAFTSRLSLILRHRTPMFLLFFCKALRSVPIRQTRHHLRFFGINTMQKNAPFAYRAVK